MDGPEFCDIVTASKIPISAPKKDQSDIRVLFRHGDKSG